MNLYLAQIYHGANLGRPLGVYDSIEEAEGAIKLYYPEYEYFKEGYYEHLNNRIYIFLYKLNATRI